MKTKNLILGGGISGLTLANFLDDYLIIEKEKELGGYCKTIYKNGFVWDYAGHFFHFKDEYFKNKFMESIDADEIVYRKKCTKIIYKKELIDYPFQMNIHQLEKDEFIDCLYDLFTKKEMDQYSNFLEMLYGKFGKSIVDKFLKPYNEKLYAIDLTRLDVNAMGRFFPYADKEKIIENMKLKANDSYNNTFMYPKKGAGVFINELSENLDKKKIITNCSIVKVDLKSRIAYTQLGEKIEFENLINTIPLNKFLEITNDNEKLLKMLSYNKVLVFNLGFNKKSSLTNEHWLYVPDKNCNYYRIGFYDNIIGQDKLSMYVEIGYSMNSIIDNNEIQEQLKLTLENLKKQNIIDDSMELIDYMSIIMDPAYVHINEQSEKYKNEYFKELNENNVYSIGRYGKWTYCSMEDCMLEAKELLEKLRG